MAESLQVGNLRYSKLESLRYFCECNARLRSQLAYEALMRVRRGNLLQHFSLGELAGMAGARGNRGCARIEAAAAMEHE